MSLINTTYKILTKSSRFLSLGRPKSGHRILMYHSIEDSHKKSEDMFSVSANDFKRQIDWLIDDPQIDIVHFNQDSIDFNRTSISITFDDGYLDNLEVAAPYLQERNIPFTVFVTSDFVSKNKESYLSEEKLKSLLVIHVARLGLMEVSRKNRGNAK